MRVLSFGEILFDIIEGENFLGGAPLNFAAHLAKCGVEPYIFSRIGEDELGEEAQKQLEDLNVKQDFVQNDSKHPTGTVVVELTDGQPAYEITENVAYDHISLKEAQKQLLNKDFDVFYFGTLIQRSETSKESLYQLLEQKSFKQIFYDINLRKGYYSKEILEESLKYCTILKLNDEEVDVLSRMFFGRDYGMEDFSRLTAKKFDIDLIITTAGAKGCLTYEDEKLHFEEGFPVRVVDTVGAGDAFSAAFIHQFFRHGDATKAASVANRLGAFVASSRGSIPDYSNEIRKIIETK